MLVWKIFMGLLLLSPWLELLTMLIMKYIFNKPVSKQWKIFFISLGAVYGLVLLIAIFVFFFGASLLG